MLSDLKWGRIIVAVLFIGIVSWFLTLIIANAYGFYVGFETRGDMEAIQEQMGAFASSTPFLIIEFLSLALFAIWQARKITLSTGSQAFMHIGIAVLVAMIIQLIMGIGPGEGSFIRWLIGLLVAAGAAFLGYQWAGGGQKAKASV